MQKIQNNFVNVALNLKSLENNHSNVSRLNTVKSKVPNFD